MVRRWRMILPATLAAGVALVAWRVAGAPPAAVPSRAPTRFEFQVVESFDAKYLGDTPGHVGRGGLAGNQPNVALGDWVYRGDTRVGRVTGVRWDRPRESLEVEFDPEPFELNAAGKAIRPSRIRVGETVSIPLGGDTAPADPKR